MLPLYALLLFRLPSVLTLRALFALPAFGVTDRSLMIYDQPSGIGPAGSTGIPVFRSASYHRAVIHFTSTVSFVQ